MTADSLKETNKAFRPRARLMELLGEQLIKDHRLALFELVKNAYDADATEVTVKFGDIREADAWIGIKDNGSGMSFDTVVSHWMEPASDHKAVAREKGLRSPVHNRIPIGEKGIGRFAVHKLGSAVSMITKTADSDVETCVEIDWLKFGGSRYLDETPLRVYERSANKFGKHESGTIIKISHLKQNWTRGDIRRLFRNVTAMTSSTEISELGLLEEDFFKLDQFDVKFVLDETEKNWLNGLFTAKNADQFAMYRYEFELTDEGFSWQYEFTPSAGIIRDSKGTISPRCAREIHTKAFEFFKLAPPGEGNWKERKDRAKDFVPSKTGIGSIRGRIIAFDLDKEITANYIPDGAGLTKFLEEQGGVRVYRDGLRVFDYGEPGNDWLGLDLRRVNRPTRRLSNNILLGEVHLKMEDSQGLKEKTNREGFIDNESYREFAYAVLCAITYLEAARNEDKQSLRKFFAPKDSIDVKEEGYVRPEDAIYSLRQTAVKSEGGRQLIPLIDKVQRAYEETRDVLLSAVGAGLGLSTIFHEVERSVRTLDRAITQGESVERITKMSQAVIELLAGAATFLRTQDSEHIKASALLDQALFSCLPRFKFHNVRFLNGFSNRPEMDFIITGTRRMLVAALVNLIDNAIYWTRVARDNAETEGTIWIGPSSDFEGSAIVIADSGGGFQDDPTLAIRPFYTRRTDGMGIGLYYCDMVMKSHAGRLAFPRHGEVDVPARTNGAVVAMIFKSK